jgi:hypothetical protein
MGTTHTNLIEVVLKVDSDGPLGWLSKAKAVGAATTAHASMFAAIASILAQLASDTVELDTAQSATASMGKDRTSARNAKFTNVKKSLRATRAAVQGLCDNAPDAAHAADIAIAAAFGVRTKPVRTKPPFAGKAYGNGVVKLFLKVPGKKGARVYYEWRMSTDGGVTWVSLPGTNVSTTVVFGLTPGQKVLFESRTTAKSILSAWSQSLGVLVQ